MQSARTKAEVLSQKEKLANSYNELLQEFSSKELRNVGNYNLGRLIGKGSFGKVYLATHKLTNGSKVVLKSSNKEDANLAREIHHHRQFLHPHIARLYEVIVTEKLVWLVLEYCPGDELYNYLLRNGPLPIEKTQRIFAQLVGAVAYVHSKSCVHRDLKLENIMLDKHENVKLCDFGFTREYEGKASYLQTFCGTICYSAPEMLKGEKYAGEKVDVWSLGIILYALIAGELPFDEDDDQVTKKKILTEGPQFNNKFSEDAISLVSALLSKRPLLRPTLADILAHSFLGEHGAEQQAILQRSRPSPFTTSLEKATLQRMKSAGVNIDNVIENVLAQRCDALAGWWALLIEKEERKENKRERRRKEREAEALSARRLSAASSRLERRSSALVEVQEEGTPADTLQPRGRRDRRSFPNPQLSIPEVPKLPDSAAALSPDSPVPPPPIDKDSIHSVSPSRQRPVPPPKENLRSRPSMLHASASQPELVRHNGLFKRRFGRRHPHAIISQLASLKHWFMESARISKSPHPRSPKSGGGVPSKLRSDKTNPEKAQDPGKKQTTAPQTIVDHPSSSISTQVKRSSNASSLAPSNASYPNHRNSYYRSQPRNSNTSHNRNSLSPSPIAPRNSYRRSSVGLRGRKSTSSSVSSIRSIHHAHTHSKASSISSNSIDTLPTPTVGRISKSPHTSVKVLPTTPNASSRFPSSIRLVRNPPHAHRDANSASNGIYSIFNEAAPPPLSSPASGLVFARRKRSAFKGPMLHTANLIVSSGPGTPGLTRNFSEESGASTTRPTTRKSQIIEEEDVPDEDIEEVDAFSAAEGREVSFEEARTIAIAEPGCKNATGGDGDQNYEPVETPESQNRDPTLASSLDFETKIIHPPRSSSLKDDELSSGLSLIPKSEDTIIDPSSPSGPTVPDEEPLVDHTLSVTSEQD